MMKHLRPGITWDGDVAFVNRRLRRYSNVRSVLGIAVLSVENIQKIIKENTYVLRVSYAGDHVQRWTWITKVHLATTKNKF